jgi:formamidopyrimidine-DNA glycosylase
MPELPEVENIKRALISSISHRKIAQIQIKTPKIVKSRIAYFKKRLTQAEVIRITRRGKNLILTLSNSYFLIIHLGMTGQIFVRDFLSGNDKHIHLIITFKGEPFYLIYRDIRKFGNFRLVSKRELKESLEKLGPDALNVNYNNFKYVLRAHKRRIKNLLLDQHLIAGIGNIYCDELLFRAKIHPLRSCWTLTEVEIQNLYQSMKRVLREAIAKGGSSVSNYVRPNASKGSFQKFHRVYRRKGEDCLRCSHKIKRIKVAQRGTYFCPHCQKAFGPQPTALSKIKVK